MQEEKEKKKRKTIERPQTDIEAMPEEFLTNPHLEEQWIFPPHLPMTAYGNITLPGSIVDPLPEDMPIFTPEGDTPHSL